jgi:hypothetical protein
VPDKVRRKASASSCKRMELQTQKIELDGEVEEYMAIEKIPME